MIAGKIDLTDETSVQIAVGTRWVELEDDSIVMDVLTDRVFRLNATAAFVWQRLQEPCSVADVQAALISAYGIDVSEARDATRALLSDLVKQGLVVTQGENVTKAGESDNSE